MTNPASTSPETLYTAAAWLHAQANEVIGRRSEAELRPAQVIELRRFERAAQDVYEKAREAARHSPGAPWLVNVATGKDYGRD
ncbi:MAG TPA: hypothetical protein VLC93_13835, partial [Myxococcota bacterium]|nr:hypothetical protein [Myxococcota bacterium]